MSGSNEALLKLVEEMRVKTQYVSGNLYVVAPDVYDKLLRERQGVLASNVLEGVKMIANSFLPPGTILEMDGKPMGILSGENEFKIDPLSRQLWEKLPDPWFMPESLAREHDDASVPLPDPEPLVELKPKPPRDNTGWSQFTSNETPPQPE